MDIFTLNSDFTADKTIDVGAIDESIWVERYNKPGGEFTLIGDPMRLRESLPEGTLISHTKTREIMVVESHSIDESFDETARIKIQGRDLATVTMEDRVVTTSEFEGVWDDNATDATMEYFLFENDAWDQAAELLNRYLIDTDAGEIENIPDLIIRNIGWPWTQLAKRPRVIKKLALLSEAIHEHLEATDVGLKTERPGPERINDGFDPNPNKTIYFTLHLGVNRTSSVVFDFTTGDLRHARYVWSRRHKKNGFYSGNNVRTVRQYSEGSTGWDTRLTNINADDWIPSPDFNPGYINDVLITRGSDEIRKPDEAVLIDASVTKTATPKYGLDYFIGDIVKVIGNYGVLTDMRVVEYAITTDKTGEDAIPTLAPVRIDAYHASCG